MGREPPWDAVLEGSWQLPPSRSNSPHPERKTDRLSAAAGATGTTWSRPKASPRARSQFARDVVAVPGDALTPIPVVTRLTRVKFRCSAAIALVARLRSRRDFAVRGQNGDETRHRHDALVPGRSSDGSAPWSPSVGTAPRAHSATWRVVDPGVFREPRAFEPREAGIERGHSVAEQSQLRHAHKGSGRTASGQSRRARSAPMVRGLQNRAP